jgi:hypothetical protein
MKNQALAALSLLALVGGAEILEKLHKNVKLIRDDEKDPERDRKRELKLKKRADQYRKATHGKD